MFGLSWSEYALIIIVALVVIGPKDLPIAIRAFNGFKKKASAMAAEFRTHVDEMMRDADLKDVKDTFNELRNFDLRSTVEKAVDPDHTLRDAFAADPLAPVPAVSEAAPDEHAQEPEPPPPPAKVPAPPFIPPALVPFVDQPEPPPPPPSFLPTGAMLQRPPA